MGLTPSRSYSFCTSSLYFTLLLPYCFWSRAISACMVFICIMPFLPL